MEQPSRRAFLAKTATGLAGVGLAGCLGAGNESSTPTETVAPTRTDTPTSTRTSTPTETDTPTESGTVTPTESSPANGKTATPTDTPVEGTERNLFPEYETTDVRIVTPDGEELGSVTAALAETSEEWTVGLSDTESLPEDWGMLFVSDSVSELTFWMREMDFGIDIVFVDDEKRITGIHHAPEPGPGEDGRDQLYDGRGQYVLEVNYRWTERHGVTEGDVLQFDL